MHQVGERFGRLVIARPGPRDPRGFVRWWVVCDCGATELVCSRQFSLAHPKRQCLECFKRSASEKAKTHGMSRSATYTSWQAMKTRCYNKNHPYYRTYGGIGVRVCRGWRESFLGFLRSMGPRPSKQHTIDRINGSLGYTCGLCEECSKNSWSMNCRWATWVDQENNKVNNRLVTFAGKTQTLAQWARESGIRYTTLRERLNRGWGIPRALKEKTR